MFAIAVALSLTADPRPTRWVTELASPRFAVRAAAAESLEKAGLRAVPALTAATRATDPEAAARAADLLARIARQQAADRLLAPTLVRLPTGATAAALAAITEQTGYQVALTGGAVATGRVTPPTEPVPVWEAIRLVCDAASLDVAAVASRGRPKPPDSDAERRLARLAADVEVVFEDAVIRRVDDVDRLRARAEQLQEPAEQAKQVAELRRAEEELQALLRQCGERAVRREQTRLTALELEPDPVGRIVLIPKGRVARSVAVAGGVRIEAQAAPESVTAGTPVGQVAILLTIRPEPRRAVERIDRVWVRRAVVNGRELTRGPEAGVGGPIVAVPVGKYNSGTVRLTADGQAAYDENRVDRPVGVVGRAETAVRLVAPLGTDKIGELFGVVRAVVRDDPADLLLCGIPGVATADGLRLATAVPDPVAEPLMIDVSVSYDPATLRPDGGSKVRFDPEDPTGPFARRGWMQWNAGQRAAVTARAGPTAEGLTVLDAGGRVLSATVVRAGRSDGTAGRVADKLTLRVAPGDGQGPPARVRFAGARATPVDLPLALVDVPAAAGTARDLRHD